MIPNLYLITGGLAGVLYLWPVFRQNVFVKPLQIKAHNNSCCYIDYSSFCRLMATSAQDHNLIIWKASSLTWSVCFHNRVMQIEIPVDSTSTRKSRPPPRFASVSARSSVKTETDRPSSLPARLETSNTPPSSISSSIVLIRCRGCTIGPYHFKSIMCGFRNNVHKG